MIYFNWYNISHRNVEDLLTIWQHFGQTYKTVTHIWLNEGRYRLSLFDIPKKHFLSVPF